VSFGKIKKNFISSKASKINKISFFLIINRHFISLKIYFTENKIKFSNKISLTMKTFHFVPQEKLFLIEIAKNIFSKIVRKVYLRWKVYVQVVCGISVQTFGFSNYACFSKLIRR